MNSKFAIVVCTYNPNLILLERLLNAVQAILNVSQAVEVFLIDNNSSPALSTAPIVQHFLAQTPQARCIVEPEQGLTAARCRAIRETSAPIVVFFDDDNEPDPNYLQILDRYFTDYLNVGIWGPGQIAVEYIDPVNSWFEQHPEQFQQRQLDFGYSCIPASWGLYLPNGTGFAVRREILEQYALAVEKGILRTTDRNGKSLASAGDVQIVWEGIKLGFAAGMIPELRCNHLITGDKANLAYLKRLHFGTASSYYSALLESFPSHQALIAPPPPMRQIYQRFAKFLVKLALRSQQRPSLQLQFAHYLGDCYSSALACNSSTAHQILQLAKQFQFI